MRYLAMICGLILIAAQLASAADGGVIESTEAPQDIAPSTDPAISFWHATPPVYADKDPYGNTLPRYRTEIRSRWTEKNLYFLFVCPYEELHLKPSASTSTETFQLWDWDVAEVFIGSDFQNTRRYREFEMSPQGEWVDLDIDLAKPHHEDGWTWNSGFVVAARIDSAAKIWYGAMRVPFSALQSRSPWAAAAVVQGSEEPIPMWVIPKALAFTSGPRACPERTPSRSEGESNGNLACATKPLARSLVPLKNDFARDDAAEDEDIGHSNPTTVNGRRT